VVKNTNYNSAIIIRFKMKKMKMVWLLYS